MNDLPSDLQLARADALRQAGKDDEALSWYARVANEAPPALAARALRRAAQMHSLRGESVLALDELDRARALAEAGGDLGGMVRSSMLRGQVRLRTGDPGGLDRIADAVAEARAAALPEREAEALELLAREQRACDRHGEAAQTLARRVSVCRDLGSRLEQLRSLEDIGQCLMDAGENDRAEAHLRRLVEHCTRAEDRATALRARLQLGELRAKAGDDHAASLFWNEASNDARATGDTTARAEVEQRLGELRLRRGDADLALTHLELAVSLRRAAGETGLLASTLAALAQARLALCDREGARTNLAEAAELLGRREESSTRLRLRRRVDLHTTAIFEPSGTPLTITPLPEG